jgi:FkbM family methyltransferase
MSKLPLHKRAYYGIIRRWSEFRFRPHIIERNHGEHTVRLSIQDLFGQGWYGKSHNEWPELDWISQNGIKPGDFVIDCGANNGFTSILFARYAGESGKVIAIEPVPHNVRVIESNLELNSVKNCELLACGAGSSNTTVDMVDMPNGTMLTDMVAKDKIIKVPVRTLDSIANGRRVDFLKIDVEGFELEVIKGAATILQGRPKMDIELHVSYYKDKLAETEAIFSLLDLTGYRIFLQMDVDGAIVEQSEPVEKLISRVASGDIVHMFLC